MKETDEKARNYNHFDHDRVYRIRASAGHAEGSDHGGCTGG
jgi:hypothetical protein